MRNFEVIKDTNETSELLAEFSNLEEAKEFAKEEVKNTNPENDNEGINIYTEEGMVMSYFGNEVTDHNLKY